MKFVSDPPISAKIRKMKQRVRWRDPLVVERDIDQTRMVLDINDSDNPEFSFLVVGDSGAGLHRGYNPQRQIAEQMVLQRDSSQFVLHTGDVIYLVGSSEFYQKNFICPYREFLVGGEEYEKIAYDRMVFNTPFLLVPGNHDYYDVPWLFGAVAGSTRPLRRLLWSKIDFDIGWQGSCQGRVYARAFLDYLIQFGSKEDLGRHLDSHYKATTSTGRCLLYEPGRFTRLPNRYYTFRFGGIDFFALDSNTFNAPSPIPATAEGEARRRQLYKKRDELELAKQKILEESAQLDPDHHEHAEILDDNRAKLEQIEEEKLDIEKQLTANEKDVTDFEQLDWLQERLIESWHSKEVRGRVLYFHHPPYVTEATKWDQAQTLEIRSNLRRVFNAVAQAVGGLAKGRPLVDLVLTGHAHCLEHLQTVDTGYADSHINWIVCGGSGYSLRRQRAEGPELMETVRNNGSDRIHKVAQSLLYIGRHGHGSKKRRPYSFIRIDVKSGCPPKFVVRPFIVERLGRHWSNSHLEPFVIGH
jgi:3',5'-cyclic AMP phosphodiesterase CpdA